MRAKDDVWYWFAIALLVVLLFKSCDYSKSVQQELNDENWEKMQDVKLYYYNLFEEIQGKYARLYYEYEDDPGRTLPMDEFTHPDDLRFPIEDYLP